MKLSNRSPRAWVVRGDIVNGMGLCREPVWICSCGGIGREDARRGPEFTLDFDFRDSRAEAVMDGREARSPSS